MPSFDQSEVKKKEYLVVKDGNTGDVLTVIFPNGIQVGIPGVQNFNSGIILPNLSSNPSNINNTLYVIGGNLYFNGNLIGVAGGANVTIKDDGTTIASVVSSINFSGSGITATASGNDITVITEADGENQIIASQVFG